MILYPQEREEDGASSDSNRSQLGSTTEQARIDDGAGSDLNRSLLRFLEGLARLRDGAGSVSSPLRELLGIRC